MVTRRIAVTHRVTDRSAGRVGARCREALSDSRRPVTVRRSGEDQHQPPCAVARCHWATEPPNPHTNPIGALSIAVLVVRDGLPNSARPTLHIWANAHRSHAGAAAGPGSRSASGPPIAVRRRHPEPVVNGTRNENSDKGARGTTGVGRAADDYPDAFGPRFDRAPKPQLPRAAGFADERVAVTRQEDPRDSPDGPGDLRSRPATTRPHHDAPAPRPRLPDGAGGAAG